MRSNFERVAPSIWTDTGWTCSLLILDVPALDNLPWSSWSSNIDLVVPSVRTGTQRDKPGRDAKYQTDRVKKALEDSKFHCGLCNISLGTKQSLGNHLKTPKHARKLTEAKNPLRCGPCNLGYNNQSSLNRHMKTQPTLTTSLSPNRASKSRASIERTDILPDRTPFGTICSLRCIH